MHIMIHHSSMVPIYEQLVDQLMTGILHGELKPEESLPSVRAFSNELKISALTVKKAYDHMEKLGYVRTVHGKGTYVLPVNSDCLKEAQQKEVEEDFTYALSKAKEKGMEKELVREIFDFLMEEIYD